MLGLVCGAAALSPSNADHIAALSSSAHVLSPSFPRTTPLNYLQNPHYPGGLVHSQRVDVDELGEASFHLAGERSGHKQRSIREPCKLDGERQRVQLRLLIAMLYRSVQENRQPDLRSKVPNADRAQGY